MTTKQIALASAAMIALAAVAIPNQADARWRGYGYGWRAPVAAGAVVGGLALGAAIASRPYYGTVMLRDQFTAATAMAVPTLTMVAWVPPITNSTAAMPTSRVMLTSRATGPTLPINIGQSSDPTQCGTCGRAEYFGAAFCCPGFLLRLCGKAISSPRTSIA